MNKISLVLLSLASLTVSVRAASLSVEPDVVVLPALEVRAPRTSPAEVRLNASLEALRRDPRAIIVGAIELPLLKQQAEQIAGLSQTGPNPPGTRVAKS